MGHSSHKGTLAARPSFSANRRLQFSPSKARNRGVRSHYVKRLMEILKVPTSRGTPSKVNSNHIMQAFLIKKHEENANMPINFLLLIITPFFSTFQLIV